jgi:hypothetical protein
MRRDKELEAALRRITSALWAWEGSAQVPKKVNDAYIAATNLLAKIDVERRKPKDC